MTAFATMSLPIGKDPMADAVFRAQKEASERTYPTGAWEYEEVTVESGPKNSRVREKVKIKVKLDEPFAFVVFADNPAFHDRDFIEWDAAARNALERFAATKGVQTKTPPTAEFGNRYNYIVEYNRVIKYQPATLDALRVQREAREKAAAERERADELRRLLGTNEGAY